MFYLRITTTMNVSGSIKATSLYLCLPKQPEIPERPRNTGTDKILYNGKWFWYLLWIFIKWKSSASMPGFHGKNDTWCYHLIKDVTFESYEMKRIPERTKNIYDKKYLLKRYLPIVPDSFLEFLFCIHISRVLLKKHYPRSCISLK